MAKVRKRIKKRVKSPVVSKEAAGDAPVPAPKVVKNNRRPTIYSKEYGVVRDGYEKRPSGYGHSRFR